MEAIDRLGWAAAFAVRSHGVSVGVRATDASVAPRLRRLLPPGAEPSEERAVSRVYSLVVGDDEPEKGIKRYSILYVDSLRAGRTFDLEDLLRRLESDLHLHVAEHAADRIFVHAGVVEVAGRAVLFPGASHSGKSTLVRALLGAGARYLSDEFAVLDPAGRVHAFPRPLGVREDGEPWPQRRIDPAELGAEVAAGPLPVGLVVLTRHRPGATWAPEPLRPGPAVLRMLEHAVPARRRPAESLRVLRTVVEGAPVLHGERGEADTVAEDVITRLEARGTA